MSRILAARRPDPPDGDGPVVPCPSDWVCDYCRTVVPAGARHALADCFQTVFEAIYHGHSHVETD